VKRAACALALLATCSCATIAQAAPALPSFTIKDATADENSGQICFDVVKHGTVNAKPSVVIAYAYQGTAKFSHDAILLEVGPAAGTTPACFKLTNDDQPGPTTNLGAKLIAIDNAKLYDGTATGTVTDGDKPPVSPITCWDGSQVTPPAQCPVKPPEPPQPVPCWDGSQVIPPAICPPEPPKPVDPPGSVNNPIVGQAWASARRRYRRPTMTSCRT
jgi:hypothetical protein